MALSGHARNTCLRATFEKGEAWIELSLFTEQVSNTKDKYSLHIRYSNGRPGLISGFSLVNTTSGSLKDSSEAYRIGDIMQNENATVEDILKLFEREQTYFLERREAKQKRYPDSFFLDTDDPGLGMLGHKMIKTLRSVFSPDPKPAEIKAEVIVPPRPI